MSRRPRKTGLAAILAVAVCQLAACSAPKSVYLPAVPDQEVASGTPAQRAWRCLLHGRGCGAGAQLTAEAPINAESMLAAQWGRALLGQAVDTVQRRATAWLDLVSWLSMPEHDSAQARAMRVVAVEALALLAVRDRRAVLSTLARRRWALTAAAAAPTTAADRFRIDRALRQLLGPAASKVVAPPLALRASWSPTPVHPRLHTGLRALRAAPSAEPLAPLPPHPLFPSRLELAPRRSGTYLVQLQAVVPSGPHQLVIASARGARAWIGGRSSPGLRAAGGLRQGPLLVHDVAPGPQRIAIAVPLVAGHNAIDVRLVVPGPPAAAREALPAVAELVLQALHDPRAGAATTLQQRYPHGPAAALLRLQVRASLDDHAPRASAATTDTVLSFFPAATDALVERAARARDDGDAALARQLVAAAEATVPLGGSERQRAAVRSDLRLERARQAVGEGRAELAVAEALAAAHRQHGDCAVAAAALDVALDAMHRPALGRLLASASGCPDLLLKRVDALAALGRLPAAASLLRTALPLPRWHDAAARRLLAIAATLERPDLARGVASSHHVAQWQRAQEALVKPPAAGGNSPSLDALLLAPGASSMEARRGYYLLGGRPPWREHQVDGEGVVSRWRTACSAAQTCGGEGAPVTWLLDHEIDVLLPGGGAIRRVHQVIAVHTARAAEAVGELQVPADAELVLARTHTADGAIWLPAATPDKESISLRKVAPGAIVEYVQVQFVSSDDGAVGATRLPAFVLASTDGPVLRSELVAIAPASWPRPPVDRSHSAPPTLELGVKVPPALGKWRAWAWRTTEQPRFRPEPRAARPEWTMPAVRLRHGVSLQQMRSRFEEVLAIYLQHDAPALAPWLARARAAGHDASRWRALVAEVAAMVKFQRSGTDPGPPAAAAANGSGDRATLLWYLARRAGVGACLVRWQPLTRTPAYGPADPRDFSASALRLTFRPRRGAPRTTWIDPGVDGGLLDYLRPGVRGRRGVLVGCDDEARSERGVFRLPELGADRDRRRIAVAITWRADGSATATVADHMAGALAALVRGYATSPDNRAQLVAQLAGKALPGWSAQWQGADGLDTQGEPLVVRYTAKLKAAAATTDLQLALFPAGLGRIYAGLPRRRTALRFAHALDTTVQLKLINEGAPLLQLPAAAAVVNPRARFQRNLHRAGKTLTVTSRLQAWMGTVPPRAYAEFAGATRAIDEAESLHLRRGMPP